MPVSPARAEPAPRMVPRKRPQCTSRSPSSAWVSRVAGVAAQLERDRVVLLVVSGVLIHRVAGCELPLLEVVRVAGGWADGGSPGLDADRLLDVGLRHVRVHEPRGD